MLEKTNANYLEHENTADSCLEHFKVLLAQRSKMLSTFYSFKTNVDENTKQLLLCMSMLSKKNYTENCLFTATSASDLINFIQSDHGYNRDDLVCALQLKLYIKKELYKPFFTSLMSCQDKCAQDITPELALFLSFNLLRNIVISFCPSKNETLYNKCLLSLFYHQQLTAYLSTPHFPSNKLSPLNKLYLSVLAKENANCFDVATQFIQLNYTESHLFEIFIISLDEAEVTQVINRMSTDVDLTPIVIKSMSYSGYRKFIPYLCHFLQKPEYTLLAFNGLKLMLGDNLDQLIPLEIQLESDENQRIKNLPYYSAKIISAWKNKNNIFEPSQMINGMKTDLDTIQNVLQHGSQQHRYFSNIHNVIKVAKKRVNHFNALFDSYKLIS